MTTTGEIELFFLLKNPFIHMKVHVMEKWESNKEKKVLIKLSQRNKRKGAAVAAQGFHFFLVISSYLLFTSFGFYWLVVSSVRRLHESLRFHLDPLSEEEETKNEKWCSYSCRYFSVHDDIHTYLLVCFCSVTKKVVVFQNSCKNIPI